MPSGGYVEENGISLCTTCHILAEEWLLEPEELAKQKGEDYLPDISYDPDALYALIDSCRELSLKKSKELEK